jgi:hypothetical protein
MSWCAGGLTEEAEKNPTRKDRRSSPTCNCSWKLKTGFPVPFLALGALKAQNRVPSGDRPVHGKN